APSLCSRILGCTGSPSPMSWWKRSRSSSPMRGQWASGPGTIDVQKKIRERDRVDWTMHERYGICLSHSIPTMRLLAGGISRDVYHTPHALHASTTLSSSPPSICERLVALGQTYSCAAGPCRGHGGTRSRAEVGPG